MKVSHESPVCLFQQSTEYNDFDYALAPRVLDHDAYRAFFRKQSDKGREVWLDTGVFEEGAPRSDEELLACISMINPTHIICPDVLCDADATIEGYYRFIDKVKDINIKLVCVAQGETEEDFLRCFDFFTKQSNIDVVCIPYDIKFYDSFLNTATVMRFEFARQVLVDRLVSIYGHGGITKPVHLLGCTNPREFIRYKDSQYGFIKSIDTSSPIVHGILGFTYDVDGRLPVEKQQQLLVDLLDVHLSSKQLADIKHNIGAFRSFVS